MNNFKIALFSLFLFTSAAQAGVICKKAQPHFSENTQKLLQKFDALKNSKKLGDCDVRIWTEDICDENTQAFLYRGIDVVIGREPNATLFGFNHYDTFLWNFSDDGTMILDSEVQRFATDSKQLSYEYHEKSGNDYKTQMNFSKDSFSSLELTILDSEGNASEHMVCGNPL